LTLSALVIIIIFIQRLARHVSVRMMTNPWRVDVHNAIATQVTVSISVFIAKCLDL